MSTLQIFNKPVFDCALSAPSSTLEEFITPTLAEIVVNSVSNNGSLWHKDTDGNTTRVLAFPHQLLVGKLYFVKLQVTSAIEGDVAFATISTNLGKIFTPFINLVSPQANLNPIYVGKHPNIKLNSDGSEYFGALNAVRMSDKSQIADYPLPATNAIPSSDCLILADQSNNRVLWVEGNSVVAYAVTASRPIAVSNVNAAFTGGVNTIYDTWVFLANGSVNVYDAKATLKTTLTLGGIPVQATSTPDTVCYVADFNGRLLKFEKISAAYVQTSININKCLGVCSNSNSNTVAISLDGNTAHIVPKQEAGTFSVSKTIALPSAPSSIETDGTNFYIACPASRKVIKLDQDGNAIAGATGYFVFDDFPATLTYSSSAKTLYVAPVHAKFYYRVVVETGLSFKIDADDYVYSAAAGNDESVISYYGTDAAPYLNYLPTQLNDLGGFIASDVLPNSTKNGDIAANTTVNSVIVAIPSDSDAVIFVNDIAVGTRAVLAPSDNFYISAHANVEEYFNFTFPVASAGLTEDVSVNTGKAGDRPNAVTFTTKSGLSGVTLTSNEITVAGLTVPTVAVNSTATIFKNGVNVGNSTTVANGDLIKLSATLTKNKSHSVVLGGLTTSWDVVESESQIVILNTLSDKARKTEYSSSPFMITGAAQVLTWVNFSGLVVTRNGVTITSPASVNVTDIIVIKIRSSNAYNERFKASIVSDLTQIEFSVATEPNKIPNFIDAGTTYGAFPSDIITLADAAYVVSGLSDLVTATIYSNSQLVAISVNGGAFVTSGALVQNGSLVAVRISAKCGGKTTMFNLMGENVNESPRAFFQHRVIPHQLNGATIYHQFGEVESDVHAIVESTASVARQSTKRQFINNAKFGTTIGVKKPMVESTPTQAITFEKSEWLHYNNMIQGSVAPSLNPIVLKAHGAPVKVDQTVQLIPNSQYAFGALVNVSGDGIIFDTNDCKYFQRYYRRDSISGEKFLEPVESSLDSSHNLPMFVDRMERLSFGFHDFSTPMTIVGLEKHDFERSAVFSGLEIRWFDTTHVLSRLDSLFNVDSSWAIDFARAQTLFDTSWTLERIANVSEFSKDVTDFDIGTQNIFSVAAFVEQYDSTNLVSRRVENISRSAVFATKMGSNFGQPTTARMAKKQIKINSFDYAFDTSVDKVVYGAYASQLIAEAELQRLDLSAKAFTEKLVWNDSNWTYFYKTDPNLVCSITDGGAKPAPLYGWISGG